MTEMKDLTVFLLRHLRKYPPPTTMNRTTTAHATPAMMGTTVELPVVGSVIKTMYVRRKKMNGGSSMLLNEW